MNDEQKSTDFQTWENQSPAAIRLVLNEIRGDACPEESLQRALKAATEIGMTPAAWNRGLTTSLIWGIPLFVIVNAVAFGMASQVGADSFQTLLTAAIVATGVFVAIGIVFGIHMALCSRRDWKNRGAVLVDCGYHPGKHWHYVQPTLVTLLTCLFMILMPYWAILGMIGLTVLVWMHAVSMMRSQLTICQNGIWRHWNLLRWDQIRSHHWEAGPTLLIQTGWTTSMVSREAIPIPAALQQQVDKILSEHLSRESTESHDTKNLD